MKITDKHTPLFVIIQLIACIPHFTRLPFWVVSWCFFFWGYLVLASVNRWSLPGRTIRYLLIGVGFLGIYFSYGYIFGIEASIGLLIVMTTLKPFEIFTHRDRMMTLFMTYFVVISGLFLSTSLLMIFHLGLCVLLTSTVLIHINQFHGHLKRQLRLASTILIQAIPLTIVFFLLFPRFEEGLWGLTRASVSQSGFSDTLAPGDVSYLVQNNDIAFRATFKGPVPRSEQLYWRGVVFLTFDGKNWRFGRNLALRKEPVRGTDEYSYSMTLEPHGKRWLFALELPRIAPPETLWREDNTILSKKPVTSRRHYNINSVTTFMTGRFFEWELLTLRIPRGVNPRAFNLAQRWKEVALDATGVVELARVFFEENEFAYTLTPPRLGKHAVDDFLFTSRRGYCEHYASAFAFLMRAADIPARIVGGYLGGEYNPYGNYIIVRQSDAHAWVEVWLDGQGWVRVDPTSFVAPERIRQGLLEALPPEDIEAYLQGNYGLFSGFFRKFDLAWDAINTRWYLWFVDYTQFRQQRLLQKLGFEAFSWREPLKFLLYVALPLAVLLGLVLIHPWSRLKKTTDTIRKTYDIFCQKLANKGLPRHPAQGPLDYAQKVAEQRQDLSQIVTRISDLYIRLRYQEKGSDKEIRYFQSLVKQFKP